MYVSQISMLYTLNLHSAACHLYPNKTGRKRNNEIQKKEREKEVWTWVSWIGEQESGVCGKGGIFRSSVVKGWDKRSTVEGEGILQPPPTPSTVLCPCRTTPKLSHNSILTLEIREFAGTNSGKFWLCERQQKKQLHIKAWLQSLSSVQSLSHVWLFVTPWTAVRQASLSITNFQSLLKLMSIELVMASNHLLLCRPLLLTSIFPSIRVFPVSQFFTSGGQSIGVSASASVLPLNVQDWYSVGWTGLISLQSKGLSSVFSNTTVWKHQFFSAQLSL